MKKIVFIVLMSFIILLFTTKYSFIYPFNDWQDANSFETVARSVLSGKVLYKDIIEQKGPVLYLLYMVGVLIGTKYISGLFIIEILSLSVVLLFIDKIVCLFKQYKYSYIVLPIFAVIFCTTKSFVHGGSAEELSLPFLMIGLFYFIKYIKKGLNYKEFLLNGFVYGIVLMIKFNLIGLWAGFIIYVFFDKLSKKKIKEFLYSFLFFLLSLFIVIFIVLVYFIINNAVYDFIFSYFIINIGSYSGESDYVILRLYNAFMIGKQNILYNQISYWLFPLFLYSVFKLFKSNRDKIGVLGLFIFMFLGIYIGLRSFKYYCLPLFIFYIFVFVYIIYKYGKVIDKLFMSKYKYLCLGVYVVVVCFVSYNNANYKNYVGMSKNDFEQYRIANIISKDKKKDLTILNYGELDYGFYNILGLIPNCKYFHTLNIDYDRLPDNYDVQNYYVKNGLVDYVIIGIKSNDDSVDDIDGLFDNYNLIYSSFQKYERYRVHFYLFKLKTVL